MYDEQEHTDRSFWDDFAFEYDDHQRNKDYRQLVEKNVCDIGAADRVIYAACGTGIIAAALSKQAGVVEAFDYSLEMIAHGRAKAESMKITNINFTVHNIEEMNYRMPMVYVLARSV